jgi:hypothetical protein
MRTRKRRGKKPPAITLSENDILDAVSEYLKNRGYQLDTSCWVKLQSGSKRKPRKPLVEIGWNLKDEPNT